MEGEDPGISSTLDFEEAYYHVNWGLLEFVMRERVLSPSGKHDPFLHIFSQVPGVDKWLTNRIP